MTRLAVGRAFDGLDVDPEIMSFNGDRLSLSGKVLVTSYGVLQAVRDRVVALVDNGDEKVIPVTFTQDSSIDGYYRPVSSSCELHAHSPTTGLAEWSIELERMGGSSYPQLEAQQFQAVRTNPHSITNATLNGLSPVTMLAWLPITAVDFWSGFTATHNLTARTSETGIMTSFQLLWSRPIAVANTYSIPPGDYYDGACSVKATYTSTSQLVLGRWAPGAYTFGTGAWVLSNGLIRVSPHATSSAFKVEVFDGTSWDAYAGGVGWRIEHDYGGGSVKTWELPSSPVTILRNSPESAAIRLAMPDSVVVAQFGRVWLDLIVHRGDRHITGIIHSDSLGSLGGATALEPTASIAATALTGGLRATSNDATGHRAVWGILGTDAATNNVTTGRVSQTGAGTTPMPFFIGVELTGSSAVNLDVAQSVIYQAFDVRGETQQVVRR